MYHLTIIVAHSLLIAGATLAASKPAANLDQSESSCSRPGHPAKPHIVLFISDDHSWHDCGPYGADDVNTPNLDRLSREGLRFQHAISPSPTCTPARSAIYTGIYPFRNGAHANHSLVKDGLKTLPDYLKKLGYRVVLAGKTHIGPRSAFSFEYLEGSNMMPPGKDHVLWTDLNTKVVDRLLNTHDRNTPLCLIICSHSPHVFWPESDDYKPDSIDLPPYLLDTPSTRAVRCRYYADVTWMDKQVGEVLASLDQHDYARNTLFIYTADQGAQWPFAKWALYDAGIRAPLLVRWPGHTKPHQTTHALVSLIDLLPTMIVAAGGTPPTDIDGRSFLPVLTGTRTEHRDAVFSTHTGDGKMNRSPMRAVRTAKYKYILNLAPRTPYTTHITANPDPRHYWTSWVKLAHKNGDAAKLLVRHTFRPAEELYDITADPFELDNLADDPAMAETLAKLRNQLKQWRLQQGESLDRVPMPEDARRGPLRYAD